MHFFLHGGSASPDTDQNKQFYQVIGNLGNRILMFPFSEWTEKNIPFDAAIEHEFFEKWSNIIARYNLDKQLQFTCASRDIPTLVEQIKNNDILFFCWGKTYKHLEVTDKIPQLKSLLQDKVIVGNSAGSVMRTKAYYDTWTESIKKWNGFLPIKMMIHRWSSRHPGLPDEERAKILDNYGEKLPIYKIPEQEYIEFEI